MSTRCSIYYDDLDGIHIFEEVMGGVVCFDFNETRLDKIYGKPYMTWDQIKDFQEKLNKYIEGWGGK